MSLLLLQAVNSAEWSLWVGNLGERDFIKQCFIKTVEIIYPEKAHLLKAISLTRKTVAEQVDKISGDLKHLDESRCVDFFFFFFFFFFFNRQRLLLLLMIFSRVWPLWFVLLQPHMILWLLKSPSRIKGVGSCCNVIDFTFIYGIVRRNIYEADINCYV